MSKSLQVHHLTSRCRRPWTGRILSCGVWHHVVWDQRFGGISCFLLQVCILNIICSSFLSRDSTVHSHCCEDLNTLWRRFVDIYPSSKSISHMWGTWNAITVATWSVAPWFSKGQGFRHRLGHKCRPLHTLFSAVLSPVDSGLEICPFPTNYVPVHGHFWTSKVA